MCMNISSTIFRRSKQQQFLKINNRHILLAFSLVCVIWLLTTTTINKNKNLMMSQNMDYDVKICERVVLQWKKTTNKDYETETEYNYDYKNMLRCFNHDESHFFHFPFVSYISTKRWIFQGFANHIYSNVTEIIYPKHVKCGDIIYVKTDFIKNFIENYHRKIKNPYILITHQSDYSVGYPEQLNFLNDPKVIKWFGQNVISKHPKLEPIPIGIAPPIGQNFSILHIMAKKLIPFKNRSILLYLSFTSKTNKNRSSVLEYFKSTFKNNKNVVINQNKIDWTNYLSHLGNSQFVLSPPGNGIDCHRTWEALAMGAVPIVLKSELQPLYDEMPVMVVNDWTEVTESNMQKFQKEKLINFSKDGIPLKPKLWLRYWISKIMNEKNNYTNQFC